MSGAEASGELESSTNATERYVWHMAGMAGTGGSSYIDSMVLRDRDAAADGTYEERRYVLQNWRADVSCIIEDDGEVIEWVRYTPYGVAYSIPWVNADRNGDDGIDDLDDTDFATDFANEHPSADLNRNGEWDSGDIALWNAAFSGGIKAEWALAPQTGLRFGYAGYVHDASVDMYHVRHRVYRQDNGRWLTRDPARMPWWGLYEYGASAPVQAIDPSGLVPAVACNRHVLTSCTATAVVLNLASLPTCIGAQALIATMPECFCAFPIILGADAAVIAACLAVITAFAVPVVIAEVIIHTRPDLYPRPDAFPWPIDIPRSQPRPGLPRCPPCPPGESRFDRSPPSAPHWPCPGDHTHIKWNTGQGPWPACKFSYGKGLWCHPSGPWVPE